MRAPTLRPPSVPEAPVVAQLSAAGVVEHTKLTFHRAVLSNWKRHGCPRKADATVTTPSAQGQDKGDADLAVVMAERSQLISLAYRLLGSVADAEDAVHEAYARWFALSRRDQEAIVSPGAWLSKVASRICLNQLSSARSRRERYVGEWIPEPVPERTEWATSAQGDTVGDPADRVTLDDSISMAFLVVLESMTPAERVAFILHDVFRYSFAEVAEIVGRSPAACRQLAVSARRRVPNREGAPTSPVRQAEIVKQFKRAWQAKDIEALISLLDSDATAVADGGGQVTALLDPVRGAHQIAQRCVAIALRSPGLRIVERTVNGQPGLAGVQNGTTVVVVAFEIINERIKRMWAVLNPEKLWAWTMNGTGAAPPVVWQQLGYLKLKHGQ